MKGILQPNKRTIKGPVTMEKPQCWDSVNPLYLCSQCREYGKYLASLPSIPAIGFEGHQPGEVEYVESECSCNSVTDCPYRKGKWFPCTVAIPSPQGEENGTIWGKMKKDIDYLESIKLTEYGQGAYDTLKKLYDEFPLPVLPNTHSLTTEQLVASKERILCAAIWYNDLVGNPLSRLINIDKGIVVCGWRHGNCIALTKAQTGYRTVTYADDGAGSHVQGFLTSRGRFVDRDEAGEIAFACGQTEKLEKPLFSEDLY